VANEVTNERSVLRTEVLPAAQAHARAAAEAVRHEVQDSDSQLRGTIVPAVARELSNPTVAGVGGGIATGISMAGHGAKTALVASAGLAGQGIVWTAETTTRALGGRAEAPTAVSDATKANLQRAKLLTRATVVVTSGMVVGAAAMAKSLGAAVSTAFMATETGRGAVHVATTTDGGRAVCRIASSSVGVVADVWAGLEGAASVLGAASAKAIRHGVGERYGAEALAAAESGIGVASDVGELAMNLRKLSPDVLAGQVAIESTRDFVARAPAVDAGREALAPAASVQDAAAAAAAAGVAAAAPTPMHAIELAGSAALLHNSASQALAAVAGAPAAGAGAGGGVPARPHNA